MPYAGKREHVACAAASLVPLAETGRPGYGPGMRVPLSSLMERVRERYRERGTAIVLALAIEILVFLLLIFMAPVIPGKEKGAIPSVFTVDSGDSDAAQEATPQKSAQKQQQAKSAAPQPAPPRPVEPPPPPAPVPPPVELPPNFVKLTRQDYRAADITGRGTNPQPAESVGGQSAAAGGGRMAGDSAVVGRAPNGEPLYRAEWFRRPTSAELQPYISPRARGPGFGVVACRMVPSYRVEDCQVIGEGPGGYAYGRAVQQAAWQFRVRPPRVGGKELYGTWVSIRITYGALPGGDDDE